MTLASLTDVLGPARAAGRGVGAFNVIQIEHAQALAGAAGDAGLPVVLQISQNAVRYHGALAPILAATRAIAEAAPTPCVLHLDHVTDADLVRQGLALGVTSVMYDGSALPYEQNVRRTAELTRECHAAGVSLEAELGEVGGKDGTHAPGVRTDPEQAARFVAATGVDALAVAVGSEHAMTQRTARLDLDLIAALADAVPVPLVLHGSSGVPDETLVAAVAAGMTKVNIATHLNTVFTAALREHLAAHPEQVDTRRYLAPARAAVRAETARLLRLLAGHPEPTRSGPSAVPRR
ncbi:MAG: class II fructose-bisphosphate aldolase family protein [Austwickia sp.]|nr:class II fructose-bisphosphate aldolase family protein [Austwickia sp.]